MSGDLVLRLKTNPGFQQFLYELKYALSGLTSEELRDIFFESSKIAAMVTYETKKKAIKNSAAFISRTLKRYQDNGFVESLKSDAVKLKDFSVSLPEKTRNVYNTFKSLSRERQVEIIGVTIISALIFFSAGGGLDMEGGIPDQDIALGGIGDHRNIFSHSIIVGLGVEFTGRFCILILNRIKNRLPENHLPFWDKAYEYIDRNKDIAVAAMWLGIGMHLLKDSGIITGGVKAYNGIPVEIPMEAHQSIFAANGMAASVFGVNK